MTSRSAYTTSTLAVLLIIVFAFSPPVAAGEGTEALGPVVEAYELLIDKYLEIQDVDRDKLIQGAIEGMLDNLPNKYNTLFTKKTYDEFKDKQEGDYVGLGMEVIEESGEVLVIATFPDTPAYNAGIRANDVIVSAAGKPFAGLTLDKASEILEGEKGSKIELKIKKPSGQVETVELIRQRIRIPPVELKQLNKERVYLIDVNRFNSNTPWELEKRLGKLDGKNLRGYILDLRNNPGGYLNIAIECAEKIVDRGIITKVVGRNGEKEYKSRGNNTPNLPLVVLINEGSASAAELVAAAIRGNDVGILAGRSSFGKGTVQRIYPIQGGYKLKLTTARYLTPTGKPIPKDGLNPELKSPGRNSDIEIALDWIRSQSS